MRAGLGPLSLGPRLHPRQCCLPVLTLTPPSAQRKGISPRPTVTPRNVHKGLTCSQDSAPKHACFRSVPLSTQQCLTQGWPWHRPPMLFWLGTSFPKGQQTANS